MLNHCLHCGFTIEDGWSFCNDCAPIVPNMGAFYARNRKYFFPTNASGAVALILIGGVLGCGSLFALQDLGASDALEETLTALGALVIGVAMVIIGIQLIRHLNDNTPDDQEIDQLFEVKARIIAEQVQERLGIDSQQQILPPLFLSGLPTVKPQSQSAFPVCKRGKDGLARYNLREYVVFYFLANEAHCYTCVYNIIAPNGQEKSEVVFYEDIVSVAIETVNNVERFELVTRGGTKFGGGINNPEAAHHTLREMRRIIQEKKTR